MIIFLYVFIKYINPSDSQENFNQITALTYTQTYNSSRTCCELKQQLGNIKRSYSMRHHSRDLTAMHIYLVGSLCLMIILVLHIINMKGVIRIRTRVTLDSI